MTCADLNELKLTRINKMVLLFECWFLLQISKVDAKKIQDLANDAELGQLMEEAGSFSYLSVGVLVSINLEKT